MPEEPMNYFAIALSFCMVLLSIHTAEPQYAATSFDLKISGPVTVDSLFRAIPPDRITIEKAQQKGQYATLDRANGYLALKYKDESGNAIMYAAALYTAGQNRRTFLMVTRAINYIAQLPYTEKFWIFEFSSGKCYDLTDNMFPWKREGDTITLPRKGTDLVQCIRTADDRGMREDCTTYTWDIRKAQFRKK
jgi:hypothetical protein